ncbi:MAG TPA: hypothetical protein ENK52_00700 [Saprospiraceae bacterium]|nr:hypothetical protein [Saprospiraceae bacterium]
MRKLFDAIGLKCHDEEKAVVLYKLGIMFGGVLSLNELFRGTPEVFHNKTKAEMYRFVGDKLPGTSQIVTKEMVDAMFKYTDIEGFCLSKK